MPSRLPIGVLVAFILAGFHADAQATLPVVRTWGDLENGLKLTVTPSHPGDTNKAMPTPIPVTFRVGLSDDKLALQGAVVLYFLGSTGADVPYTPQQWGVYWLQIDGKAWEENTNTQSWGKSEAPNGTLFYAQAIPFLAAGDHVIELVRPYPDSERMAPHKVLARAKIHLRDRPGDRWYPLWTTQNSSSGAESGQDPNGARYAMESVLNPQGDWAVPHTPYPAWYSELPPANQALPTLFPPDNGGFPVKLSASGSTLTVTFAPKIEGFFPDDYFLTRWWVNGQPASLDPKAERPGQMRVLAASMSISTRLPMQEAAALVWYTQDVHFDLTFKPEWLRAAQGDRIGVQFLYCHDGFLLARMPGYFFNTTEPSSQASPDKSFSQLSNRIEFTYSGDPKNPIR